MSTPAVPPEPELDALLDALLDEELDPDQVPVGVVRLLDAAALVAPEAPAPVEVLDAVLEALERPMRLYAARLARVFDWPLERVGALLSQIDEGKADFMGGLGEGVQLLHVEGGPRLRGHLAGIVRVEPGAAFPAHTHIGPEVVLVLQGTLLEEDGRVLRPGDIVPAAAGGSHTFRAGPEEVLLYATAVADGVDFGPLGVLPPTTW